MLRPSHVLAFVTAMLASEAGTVAEAESAQKVSRNEQPISAPRERMSEEEQIVYEARRQLGRELCR